MTGNNGRFAPVHGCAGTSTYNIWKTMKSRCSNPNLKAWRFYGGKGVSVCDRWKESFQNFLEDMGHRPFTGAQLDRIDGSKGYSPENCRWVTSKVNNRHREDSVSLTYNGITKLLIEWAADLEINPKTLFTRYYDGWTTERMLTTPVRKITRKP